MRARVSEDQIDAIVSAFVEFVLGSDYTLDLFLASKTFEGMILGTISRLLACVLFIEIANVIPPDHATFPKEHLRNIFEGYTDYMEENP